MIDPIDLLKEARELGSAATLADVEAALVQFDYEELRAQERARYHYDLWDGISDINGVPAASILERVPRHNDENRTPGSVYLIWVDGRLLYLQPHDPDQAGLVPMTPDEARQKAEQTINRLVENAVDAYVRSEVLRQLLR